MRQALHILRKDIRHLWPRAALFAFVTAIAGVFDVLQSRGVRFDGGVLFTGLLFFLAVPLLVLSPIQQERLVGDRQFWITRPYRWQSLVIAKLLFLGLFFCLPIFLEQCSALAASGISPLRYLPQLFSRQLMIAGVTLLFWIALALVTSDFAQLAIFVIGGYAAIVLMILTFPRVGGAAPFPGCAEPAYIAFRSLAGLLVLASAAWWMYRRRTSFPARCMVAALAVLSILPVQVLPWGAAFALVKWSSPAVDPSIARLSPDPDRTVERTGFVNPQIEGVQLRVLIRLSGIPAGMALFSERAQFRLEAPDGATTDSGWNFYNLITDQTHASSPIQRTLPGAGDPYWLEIFVNPAFLDAHRSEPLHLHASVAFTLFDRAHVTAVTGWDRRQSIGGDSFCYLSKRGSFSPALLCFVPFEAPALSVVYWEHDKAAVGTIEGSSTGLAPGLGGASIWNRINGSLGSLYPSDPSAVSIETRNAVAHFERTLDAPNLVLRSR